MTILGLAIRNIKAGGYRSLVVCLCVAGIAGFFLASTLIIRGAGKSLDTGLQRLGADIIVVPAGAESRVETALLTGKPTSLWMPESNLARLAAVRGVGRVSPQIFLSSLQGASCCALSETFLVVFDPDTDFAVSPWLEEKLGRGLAEGEIIAGSLIYTPPGEEFIRLYGYPVKLRANLEATGTGTDQTVFMTIETARAIAASSLSTAESPLEIPENNISAVLVKVLPDADPHTVALRIMLDVPGLFPIETPGIFGGLRRHMAGLLDTFILVTGIIWAISALLVGLVFSMAVNERRRDIAVLQAIGATRSYVFRLVLAEAALLALGAGAAGIGLATGGVFLFRDLLKQLTGMPFLFPDPPSFLALAAGGIGLALGMVAAGAFLPAFRASRREPALAMRQI